MASDAKLVKAYFGYRNDSHDRKGDIGSIPVGGTIFL